jgi:outer membrane immunogenic protein
VHDTHDLTIFRGGGVTEATGSSNKWGWMAGAGVEYALTRNWSAKLEYDFMDFGTSRFVFDTPFIGNTGIVTADVKQRIQVVKFGWNYKFDWGGPVVANY